MVRRKQRRRRCTTEEDPMTGTANLVDAMLVLAVGFLIFVVMSWNMQSIIFSDMSQDERNTIMDAMRDAKQIDQGREIENPPEISQSSGQGYTEMGTVYKDPTTGKMFMIEQ